MPVVYKSALVTHSAAEMFELVNDVDSYRLFLPWCHNSQLLSRNDTQLCGEIEVARVGIKQKFSTCNTLYPYERIDIHLKEGPFSHLDGHWLFTALGESACKVELELEFRFAGRLIDTAFGKVFGQIAGSLVSAFCKRADEVYSGK